MPVINIITLSQCLILCLKARSIICATFLLSTNNVLKSERWKNFVVVWRVNGRHAASQLSLDTYKGRLILLNRVSTQISSWICMKPSCTYIYQPCSLKRMFNAFISAKSSDTCQPARNAQADIGRYFLQFVNWLHLVPGPVFLKNFSFFRLCACYILLSWPFLYDAPFPPPAISGALYY